MIPFVMGREMVCVLDCCLLHVEFTAGVFGVAYTHDLQAEDVHLKEVAGHSC